MPDEIPDSILDRSSESADLDFKSSFDPTNSGEWLEIVKDVVAFANSGGGTILIGANNDGTPSGSDVSTIVALDPADLTNKIYKYTGMNFQDFDIVPCAKNGTRICAIRMQGTHIPMVFTKVGTYEVSPGKQKNVFSVGTVYFRHGAKSEPCTSDDLRSFLEREVEYIRRSWLDGIAKVVEAPTGSRIAVLPPELHPSSSEGDIPIKLVSDASAPHYYAVPLDHTHPFRQKEVVAEVAKRLRDRKITSHDILCVRRAHNVDNNIDFCYTQKYASPRYSQAFVDWIIAKAAEDVLFFEDAKAKHDASKRSA
jgi:hypothetical protein